MDAVLSKVMFPLTLWGSPLMALAALGCLIFCRGPDRRRLAWAAGVFLSALALFFGGKVLLGFFGLTWRNLPSLILLGTLLVSGWAGIVLTLACLLPQEWPELAPVLRWTVKGGALLLSGVILFVTILYGPFFVIWGFGGEERVLGHQGQTLLEVDESWLDPYYCYYSYHGPLVRGTERIWSGPTHIWGDFDLK